MSHSVTITRTTTTSASGSALILNTGYFKTVPGLLKIAQFILGALAVNIVAWIASDSTAYYRGDPQLFFLLISTAFLIGTFCLILSCLISFSTGGIISKTIYELIYHSIAFILYLIASIILMLEITRNSYYTKRAYNWFTTAYVLGFVLTILYLISAILARKSYRGI